MSQILVSYQCQGHAFMSERNEGGQPSRQLIYKVEGSLIPVTLHIRSFVIFNVFCSVAALQFLYSFYDLKSLHSLPTSCAVFSFFCLGI